MMKIQVKCRYVLVLRDVFMISNLQRQVTCIVGYVTLLLCASVQQY